MSNNYPFTQLFVRHLLIATVAIVILCNTACSDELKVTINWPEFMSRHDLLWKHPPRKWEEGAFMGNGLLGANVYTTADGKLLQWRMGRTDVVDRGNRIPIGDLVLHTQGILTDADLRLDLWNAELVGDITTTQGKVRIRSFTHADEIVQVIELRPLDGKEKPDLEWQPGLAVNPRHIYQKVEIPEEERNPAPSRLVEAGIELALQPLTTGGGHATAWKVLPGQDGSLVVVVSVGYSTSSQEQAKTEAVAAINEATVIGLAELTESHRRWWHGYWPRSFLSIPDTRMESFYWIQLYKMASGTRADRPLLDLMGPWFQITPWPRIWWNLNIQLTYWPQLASNRLDLGESLFKALDTHHDQLARNARPFSKDSYAIGRSCSYDLDCAAKPEIGNLTWALHNYYLHYRYLMDDELLRERLFPLLKGSINYYLHLLKKGEDGLLHIPLGLSPEYPTQPDPNPDCNYDLALLRWGCQTLLQICDRLEIDDPLIPKWRETLEKLVPYPVDENGYKVSAAVSFQESHRHYSHLMMIYPLYLINLYQPENQVIVTTSLNHWMGLEKALRGYSFTGAASISALLGRGDDAARYLNMLLDGQRFVIHPNTMYTEAGPVVETPLSAATSIHDMLLSSWGNKIRVFPAVPKSWPNVTFHRMRTEGAFLVSAIREGGVTKLIRIESLAGEPCRLVTDMVDPQGEGATVTDLGDSVYQVELSKGQAVVLTPSEDSAPQAVLSPVPPDPERLNFWGLNETLMQ